MFWLIIIALSMMSGVAVFDAVTRALPMANNFVVWISQKVAGITCGIAAFGLAFMILFVACECVFSIVREVNKRANEK